MLRMTVAVNDAIPLYDGKNLYIEQGMENGYYSMKDIIDRCKKNKDDIDIIIIDERFDNVWSYRKIMMKILQEIDTSLL